MARTLPALLAALTALVLAGCSFSFSTGGVDMDEVADEARKQLSEAWEEQGGAPFPEVTCPDDLQQEVGAATICFSHFDGARHRIRVEVTEVDGDRLDLDFQSDAVPTGSGAPTA